MRDAATVLEIIRERGRRGLPLERVYRCLFNPDLYLLAYGKLYRNAGAMTPGATSETVDGMNLGKIEAIITALRTERYRWTPVRRTYIEKKGTTKKRPLGLPTWSDKLLQEVLRLLLEAYYEPQFCGRSHGFRPGRGCHTALAEISHQWHGTVWFIEGDISDCFGSLDHSIMRSILAEKIHDGRFLRLIDGLLQAGYLEDWRYHQTLSGCPQGDLTRPEQYLPGPAGQLHRTDPLTCPQSGSTTQAISPLHAAVATRLETGTTRRREDRSRAAQADADHALPRSDRSRLPAATLLPLCRRLAAELHRLPAGSRADQDLYRRVPPREAQIGVITDQDLDHPRADTTRPVPRL